MRIVYMGSSAASATCLRAILREEGLDVVGVVTQPDRPAGRGKTLTPCACKAFALEHGLGDVVISPENVNSEEAMAQLRAWNPDIVVVVAFGQILRQPLLDLPLFGCINCHFSLLPKYRGAAPVAAAIAAGDRVTGVTIMKMGPGLDDGPILYQRFEPIYLDATGGELMDGLAITGGVALAKTLKLLSSNALPPSVPQDESEATYVHKLKKSDGLIDWSAPVLEIERKIRAYTPWPSCHTFLPERFRRKGNSGRLVILRARIVKLMDESWKSAAPGTILKVSATREKGESSLPPGPIVKCGDTALLLTELKPEGGAPMDGGAFLRGRPLQPGTDRLLNA